MVGLEREGDVSAIGSTQDVLQVPSDHNLTQSWHDGQHVCRIIEPGEVRVCHILARQYLHPSVETRKELIRDPLKDVECYFFLDESVYPVHDDIGNIWATLDNRVHGQSSRKLAFNAVLRMSWGILQGWPGTGTDPKDSLAKSLDKSVFYEI